MGFCSKVQIFIDVLLMPHQEDVLLITETHLHQIFLIIRYSVVLLQHHSPKYNLLLLVLMQCVHICFAQIVIQLERLEI